MKDPELYEESVRIHSANPNDMQTLDILDCYLEFGNTDKVPGIISERNREKRFTSDALYLKEKALKIKGEIPALKKVQRQIYLEYPSIDRLKEYLDGLDSEEQSNIIQKALKTAKKDTDLCRGVSVLLEYRQHDTVRKMLISRKEELEMFFMELCSIPWIF